MISKLALGTAQLGVDAYGISNSSPKPKQNEVNEILDYALNKGIVNLDISNIYGSAERYFGNYSNRNLFKINMKISECSLESSMDRMKIDKAESCMIHHFEDFVEDDSIIEPLLLAKKHGQLNKTGFSLHYPEELNFIIEYDVPCDIVQIPFNISDTRFINLIEKAKEKNIEVHARSCFLQGVFFMNPDKAPDLLQSRVQKIKQYSEDNEYDIDKILMGFCLENNIDKLVFGVNNKEQLQRNIEISQGSRYKLSSEFLDFMSSTNEDMLLPFRWKEDDWLEKLEK